MQFGTRDRDLNRTAISDFSHTTHSKEEEHPRKAGEPTNQVLPTEWSLLPRAFDSICEVYGHPYMDLFSTRANITLSTNLSLVLVTSFWPQKE